MPTREHLAALGTARGRRLAQQFGNEIRHARLAAGLSQARVAAAVGLSQETISRFELGQAPHATILQAARLARMVGLELSVRCFPAPGPLRDEAHIKLIGRFLARVPPSIQRRLEAPILPNDQRAWDVLLGADTTRIGVIAETRIRDLQALFRREHQKQLDGRVDVLLLVVADTWHNRGALREASLLVSDMFPLRTRGVLTRLSRGLPPPGNGVVII